MVNPTKSGNREKSRWGQEIVVPALWASFVKLSPRTLMKNPVMFVVEVGAVLTSVDLVRGLLQRSSGFGFSLQITVWKDATLSGTVPVRPDGMISMKLIGDLRAAGLTPMALAADISQRLKKYLQDPVVTVVVLGVNSQRIFAVGEVNKVGPLMLTPGMTTLQAIVSAGGLTPFASSKKIYILRNVGGKQEKIPFNYKQALKGDNQGILLIPGDTIVVP